ncbi:tail assembly chaperone [Mycobacterium phage GodPhather]|uniref:Tail assembly chaperone n=1 Tax=Mycobacterium phage Jeon TaxID=2108123 RepID=A0A2P1JRH2_9CAUD|nr:tail assembly chaperone [Mycobacterium phage Jeon]AVO21723.1 tail assembly chaperone [Mycobacterium phage Jeon]QBP32594.1 tail assembly chaperone [Mycobacterium phage GodPhather]
MTVYASDGTEADTTPSQPAPQPAPEPQPAQAEPEPMEIVDGEPVDDKAPADVAATDRAPAVVEESDILEAIPPFEHSPGWPHSWIDFEGDRLAFRVPKPAAVTGFSSSQNKYVPNREKGDNVQLFLRLHLSPESYQRVIFRMMHPESTYDLFTLAKLVDAILTPGVKELESQLEQTEKSDDDKAASASE